MIKVIAFDLIGVLVSENDFVLTEEEQLIERLFGKNISDNEFILEVKKQIENINNIEEKTEYIINNIYDVKNIALFESIKKLYPEIKIVIATNHVSYVRKYIMNNLDIKYIDDIFISAEINKIKPNSDFFQYILDKMNISANNLIFLDDSYDNVEGAKKLFINTIQVDKNTDILGEIKNMIN